MRSDTTNGEMSRPRLESFSSTYTSTDRIPKNSLEDTEKFEVAPPMETSMICSTVVQDGKKIAFACYDEERREIILECDYWTTNDPENVIARFLDITKPNLLLLGNKIVNDASLLQMLTKPHFIGQLDEHNPGQAFTGDLYQSTPYRLIKSGSFDLRGCKARILQKLRVLSLLRENQVREHARGFGHVRNFPRKSTEQSTVFKPSAYHSLATLIDFDSKAQVQAVGSLISFLQDSVFRLSDEGLVTVDRIILAKSHHFMRINSSTLSSLHIFSTEHHPLIAKGQGNAKEGWSLYSLLDRTKSKGGRSLLKEWMLRPLVNLENIEERQDAVELFMQPGMQTHVGIILSLLGQVGSVNNILSKMQKSTAQANDFLVLIKTLAASLAICSTLGNDILPRLEPGRSQAYLERLFRSCNVDLVISLQERITDVIDEMATIEMQSGIVIQRGFHPQLDQWKDKYEDLDCVLEEVAEKLYIQFPQLKDLSVVFVPQVGFLVCLQKEMIFEDRMELPSEFTHIFNQDEEAFFKNAEMRQLDENIGDLDGLIKDTEGMIVAELEEVILEKQNQLRRTFRSLSALDCILSFACCAVDLKFTRPKMESATKNQILIKNGRHPLQEIITESEFIPNDVEISNTNRILLVTGPNFSGKSCYLRQVGLLVYMAHIGSFIPCSEATISIVDQIFARICTVETCAVPQSSFQLDLTEMGSIFLKATSSSLVLIDEFGKGTSPASGIALVGAALKELSKLGCMTVCTTHFLELFSMNIIDDQTCGFKARRMAIQLPSSDEESATPLFKLEDGVASSSAGLYCAKRAGLDHKIVDRAKEIIKTIRGRRKILPLPEAVPRIFELSPEEREMLLLFFSVDSWESASEEELRTLIQKISRL